MAGRFPLADALEAAGPKPAENAARSAKKNYAEALSRALALLLASRLRPEFPSILPTAGDTGHETPFAGDQGKKRLDVAVWHQRDGLLLDLSIKTYAFRDWSTRAERAGRRTKNVVRNDHELRAEADKIHRRQPYAVLVGLMFVPITACDDGKSDKSSFAHMVLTFRKRTGREGPDDRYDRFEAFFVGLYEEEGPERGAVRFFDVTRPPPRQGRPRKEDCLSLDGLVQRIRRCHDERNAPSTQWGLAEDEDDDDATS